MVRNTKMLLAALCLYAPIAQAGDKPLYQPAPAWVKPSPAIDLAKLSDDDPTLIVLDQQQRVEGARVWSFANQALRVTSAQMMNQIGQISLPWQPDHGDLILHSAEIIRDGERIDLIAKGQRFEVLHREQQLEQHKMDGMLTATMAIEGLRLGDVVHLSYSVTNSDDALKGNAQALIPLLADPARAKFARARLSWPAAAAIRWRSHADGVNPTVQHEGAFDAIEIALPLAKQPEMPSDAPAGYLQIPILETSTFADWETVSRTMAPLYQTAGLIPDGSPLAGEVAKIAAKSPDLRVRAALALRLVQDEVRYLFQGMNGGNYVPQSPDKTWSLRYGDCKAKTLLLLAILHKLGIEAEPVLANSTLGDLVPKRLPSAGAFDHVLVRAVIDGKSLWLDGTSGGARLADIDDVPAFRNVLPVRAAGTGLMSLASTAPKRPTMEIDLEVDQTAGLSLPSPFSAVLTAHGPLAQIMHSVSREANREQWTGYVQSVLQQFTPDALIAAPVLTYDPESAAATLKVRGLYTSPWKLDQGRYRFVADQTVAPFEFQPDRGRPAWRDIPVATGMPLTTVTRIRVHLPAHAGAMSWEGDQSLPASLAGVAMQRSASLTKDWLVVEDRVRQSGADVPAKAAAGERAQAALAKTRLLTAIAPADYPPRWKDVMLARKADAFAAIVAAYSSAIADDPKSSNGYANRAAFYGGIWDWKNAEADYTRAIELEPTAYLYSQRSYMRDVLGDAAGAMRDAEEALKLDPGSATAVGQIAGYKAEQGKLDEGLTMLAERAAAGGKESDGYVQAQAQMLDDAGRPAEGVALLDGLIARSPGRPDLLNSRCWIKGTGNVDLPGALKDCTKSIELSESPAAALDSRAMVYFRMGRFEDAMADLEAALAISPSLSASLFMRGVIRKRTGAPGSEEDLAAARMMSPKIDRRFAKYGIRA